MQRYARAILRQSCCCAIGLVLLSNVLAADNANPMETLKTSLEQGMAILNNPQYKDPAAKRQQRDQMWAIIKKAFDFKQVARFTLGRHWKTLTLSQQQIFTSRFAALLGEIYMDRVQSEFTDEKVIYSGYDLMTANKAQVKTRLIHGGRQIPMEYRMILGNAGWRIYDVVAEGVSLVQNYRTQFDKILLNGSPDDLIQQVTAKVNSLKAL